MWGQYLVEGELFPFEPPTPNTARTLSGRKGRRKEGRGEGGREGGRKRKQGGRGEDNLHRYILPLFDSLGSQTVGLGVGPSPLGWRGLCRRFSHSQPAGGRKEVIEVCETSWPSGVLG